MNRARFCRTMPGLAKPAPGCPYLNNTDSNTSDTIELPPMNNPATSPACHSAAARVYPAQTESSR